MNRPDPEASMLAIAEPPWDPESEHAVLGGLMLDNSAWDRTDGLESPEFYRVEHRLIYTAIGHLIGAGKEANILTVKGRLDALGQADDCGGETYLYRLTQSVASASGMSTYSGFVRDCSARRRLIADANNRSLPLDPERAVAIIARATPSTQDSFADWPDGRIEGFFENDPPQVQWFCHERLLAGRGHALAGIGGSSKTRVLYHLGVASAIGVLPWDWDVSITGSAALFLTEDVAAQVHRTLHLMGQQLPPNERRLLAERLRVFPLAGKRAQLLGLDSDGGLHETQVYDWLMRQLDAMPKPIAFVGIDPALGVTEGDELSQAHQRRLGGLVDHIAIESGACVVLSAHAAKGSMLTDEPGSHSSRGGGAITDAVRGEFVLRNLTPTEALGFGITDPVERKRYVQLAATKGNELPPEAYVPVWLKRVAGGGLMQAALTRTAVGEKELKALSLLAAGTRNGDVFMSDWRGLCVAAGVIPIGEPKAQERAMERIRNALREAHLVEPGLQKGVWRPA